MSIRVGEWRKRHKLDEKLLNECAYYPRIGCGDCSWEAPSHKCRWSHILVDTRVGGQPPFSLLSTKRKKRGETAWGVNLNGILKGLPEEAQREIRKILGKEGGETI